MDSLGFQFIQPRFYQNPRFVQLHQKPCLPFSTLDAGFAAGITCSLRRKPRKSLWRSKLLSSEAIQVVHALKLAKSPAELEKVFTTRLCRLLKGDLLGTLSELQRQNELDLALKVFKFVQQEVWYKPDLLLYCDMILLFGRNKKIDKVEDLFNALKKDGLEPDTRTYTEVIGSFFQAGMIEKAIETYRLMKASGCVPDELTLTIMIRNLENADKEELALLIKKESAKYVDCPETFLEEVGRSLRKRWVNLV